MTSTLSAQGQLLAGVEAALTRPLTGISGVLAATDGLRYAWPAEDLVAAVTDPSLAIFPFVVLSLGDETPDPAGGVATAYGGAGNRIGPTVNGLATTLIETDRWMCPLTLMVVAAGNDGLAVADRVRTLAKTALRRASLSASAAQNTITPTIVLPLPDDLETATTVPGLTYGLSATLDDLGAHPDFREAGRQLWRIDLRYRAHYSEYRPEVATIAHNVSVTYEAGIVQPITIVPSPDPWHP